MKHASGLLLSSLSLVWGATAVADEGDVVTPLIDYFEAGVLCAQNSSVSRGAPDTVAGTTHVIEDEPPFVSNGRLVPAVLGIGFGVRSSVSSAIGQDGVTMTVTHPPFSGSGATQQSFVTAIGPQGSPGITLYQFDYGYELALGTWTLTASVGDDVLYQATFTVVPPSALPDLAGACGYLDLLS